MVHGCLEFGLWGLPDAGCDRQYFLWGLLCPSIHNALADHAGCVSLSTLLALPVGAAACLELTFSRGAAFDVQLFQPGLGSDVGVHPGIDPQARRIPAHTQDPRHFQNVGRAACHAMGEPDRVGVFRIGRGGFYCSPGMEDGLAGVVAGLASQPLPGGALLQLAECICCTCAKYASHGFGSWSGHRGEFGSQTRLDGRFRCDGCGLDSSSISITESTELCSVPAARRST